MTTKERLQAEPEHLSEEDVAELLRVIQSRGRAGTGRERSAGLRDQRAHRLWGIGAHPPGIKP